MTLQCSKMYIIFLWDVVKWCIILSEHFKRTLKKTFTHEHNRLIDKFYYKQHEYTAVNNENHVQMIKHSETMRLFQFKRSVLQLRRQCLRNCTDGEINLCIDHLDQPTGVCCGSIPLSMWHLTLALSLNNSGCTVLKLNAALHTFPVISVHCVVPSRPPGRL